MVVMGSTRPHTVIIPFPAQGHVRPLMQLALRLNRVYGFFVTFVNTSYIHKTLGLQDVMNIEDGLNFLDLQDGIPDSNYIIANLGQVFHALQDATLLFEDLFKKIQVESLPITCVITDLTMMAAHNVVIAMGLPSVGFSTNSTLVLSAQLYTPRLVNEGLLPLPPPPEGVIRNGSRTVQWLLTDDEKVALTKPVTCVPGMYPMQLGEFYSDLLVHDISGFVFRFLTMDLPNSYQDRAWILVNTFHELEATIIDSLQQDIGVKVTAIGPMVIAPTTQEGMLESDDKQSYMSSLWQEDMKCMEWLDIQKPLSVIYISFGSLTHMTSNKFEEFLLGLEDSQVLFILVLRANFVNDSAIEESAQSQLPTGFEERTKDRALIVQWAPQLKVLGHPAIAGFVTHCGWNSVLESMCMGVPMLTYPYFADQSMNSRYVVSVWKSGWDFERQADGSIARHEVVAKIMRLVAKNAIIRIVALKWKDAAKRAMEKGGSSNNNLEAFVANMYERAQIPSS